MASNFIYIVFMQILILQDFIDLSAARPNLVTAASRLGFPAIIESMIPNMGCASNCRVTPPCLTNVPITEAIIPNNINFLPPRFPVSETVVCNGNIVSNVIPNVIKNAGLPVSETILQNIAPCTTVIQDTSVSNNLANALQLLVVSNLLSNTLQSNGLGDVVLPGGIAAPVFEQIVGGGCVNTPLLNNNLACGNVVKLV